VCSKTESELPAIYLELKTPLRTGHSPLLAAYIHRIGRRDSATCPHCIGAEETAEHLVFQCPAHNQARRETWPDHRIWADPRRLWWSFLEKIGVVNPLPLDWEWERRQKESWVEY